MIKFMISIFVLVVCICCPLQADAFLLIDTGVASDLDAGPPLFVQWLAVEFDLNQAFTITSIESAFRNTRDVVGNLALSIYQDGGDVPDVSSLIYSDVFNVTSSLDQEFGWYGLHGLSLNLSPGQYWAAFEVNQNHTYRGVALQGAAPLDNEAFGFNGFWSPQDNINLALRVHAERPGGRPIPEPATWMLVSLGMGMIYYRRR